MFEVFEAGLEKLEQAVSDIAKIRHHIRYLAYVNLSFPPDDKKKLVAKYSVDAVAYRNGHAFFRADAVRGDAHLRKDVGRHRVQVAFAARADLKMHKWAFDIDTPWFLL